MLCDFCVQTPEITAFYHMVGNFNVLLRFAVPDVKTLDALVGKIKTFGDSSRSDQSHSSESIFTLLQLSRGAAHGVPCLCAVGLTLTIFRARFILITGESRISRLSGEVHTVSVASGIHGPRRAL